MQVPEWLRKHWYPTIRCLHCPCKKHCNHWEKYRDCMKGNKDPRPGDPGQTGEA